MERRYNAKRVHEQGTAREALRHGLLQSVHWAPEQATEAYVPHQVQVDCLREVAMMCV
jgi:hypothetical protein